MTEPRLLDTAACAVYVGRTEKAVRRLVERRQIPYVRQGRRIFFEPYSLDVWIRDGRVPVDRRVARA